MSPFPGQLNRRRLYHRSIGDSGSEAVIKKIIEQNSSLRIAFGWSFESTTSFEEVMQDCVTHVIPKYNISAGNMCSDTRCDWLGFMPFNVFEQSVYEDLSLYNLILFNNEMIDYQIEVVTYVANHKLFRQHAIVRGHRYRYEYFKTIRKDNNRLSDMFMYYINAIKETSLVTSIPRDIVEQDIGCHFLYHPEVFFELLEFSILKGDICE
jgi:hypothetical protein